MMLLASIQTVEIVSRSACFFVPIVIDSALHIYGECGDYYLVANSP